MKVTNEMVDRFLAWQLPKDFAPDCFISFDKERAERNNSQPVGTNLLTADQARQMLEHVLTEIDAPQSAFDANELRRALCNIGIVGCIDGHDVIRRNSTLEILDRRIERATPKPAQKKGE